MLDNGQERRKGMHRRRRCIMLYVEDSKGKEGKHDVGWLLLFNEG